MARRPTQQARIDALLEKYDPIIRAAFQESIRDIVDRAKLGAIVSALERGDIEGAVRAVGIDPAAFQPLDNAIRQAFIEGGTTTAGAIATSRPDVVAAVAEQLIFRFDARNPAAETWLSTHSSKAITEIVSDQRVAVRSALTNGMERGVNPRTTALDVVGRQDPQSGRRVGGIIGLNSQQERYVANARRELTSGNPAEMQKYLDRARRDRRFDAAVVKAIKDGKPVDAATASRLVSRYADRLLALRGENVARTESIAALNGAQFETYRQAVEKGAVAPTAVRKVWVATRDKRTRDSHRHLNGETAGLNERFANGLMFPGDPDGAAAEVINCRCRLIYRIDRLSNLE